MKSTDQTKISELVVLAYRGAQELRSRSKASSRVHADRVKRFDQFIRAAVLVEDTEQLPGIAGLSIDPEMELMLHNPTHGL